jgi:hypothetical protein
MPNFTNFNPVTSGGPLQNYTPHIPTFTYFQQPKNPTKFDVFFGSGDYLGLTRSGTLFLEGLTDVQAQLAKRIVDIGANRDTTLYGRTSEPASIQTGIGSPLDAQVMRRFGLLKLVNGDTGKSTVMDVKRGLRRFQGRPSLWTTGDRTPGTHD